jgi:hypothetical protein
VLIGSLDEGCEIHRGCIFINRKRVKAIIFYPIDLGQCGFVSNTSPIFDLKGCNFHSSYQAYLLT